nr:hypothetical protein [Tanacetum cinerariifolium]
VNTPRSGKDSLKLNEFMELCINLQQRLLDLETRKTTQALEINSLKRRVKKLEKRKWSRTHGLKILYNVGLSARVESSKDKDMFGVNDLDGDDVIVENVDVAKQAKEVVNDITLAKALMEIKSANPKTDKVVIQEQEQVFLKQPSHVKDKGKGKMVEPKPVKKFSKKDQLILDEELSFKLQAEEEEEERLAREKLNKLKKTELVVETSKEVEAKVTEGSSKRAGEELEQENAKNQKIDDDKETTKLKQLVKIIQDEERVATDVIPLAVMPPSIIDCKIHKEGKKTYY